MAAERLGYYGGRMSAIELLLVREECRSLSVAYARALDFRDYDALANLFTDDGILDTVRQAEGREAIRASLGERSDEIRTRHVITNMVVEVMDDDVARGLSYLCLYRHQGSESLLPEAVGFAAPAAVGHYEDGFRRTDAGWRFTLRKLHLAFRNPDLF